MRLTALRLTVLCSAGLLIGCGEGYVFERTDSFPYNNERTAGTGVAYVLAKMKPAKELKVEEPQSASMEPEASTDQPPASPPPAILEAEEIFDEEQKKSSYKGVTSKKTSSAHISDKIKAASTSTVVPQAGNNEGVATLKLISEDVSKTPDMTISVGQTGSAQSKTMSAKKINVVPKAQAKTAEDYIAQAPKVIEVPEVEIIDAEDLPAEVPSSGYKSLSSAYAGQNVKTIKEQIVETTEDIQRQPAKEVISPKRDSYTYRSVGEEQLQEIYSNPM